MTLLTLCLTYIHRLREALYLTIRFIISVSTEFPEMIGRELIALSY